MAKQRTLSVSIIREKMQKNILKISQKSMFLNLLQTKEEEEEGEKTAYPE